MKRLELGGYIRVTKRTARKLFNNGMIIRICACNVNIISQWNLYTDIDNQHLIFGYNSNNEPDKSQLFDNIINHYMYYNCNSELGNYVAYYIKNGGNK